MILSEKWIRKMSEKNDWRIVYKTIYYDFEWKIESKIDKKMSQILTEE